MVTRNAFLQSALEIWADFGGLVSTSLRILVILAVAWAAIIVSQRKIGRAHV